MKRELLIKTLALGIVVLFICMNVNPSLAVDNVKKPAILGSDGNTLYVGGSGPGNYSKIQDAINHSSYGDTIFVYSGIYNENLHVRASITLRGENKTNTIIDGNFIQDENVIRIYSMDYVIIDNFTIKNSSENGIYLYSGNYNKIMNCIIYHCDYGIYLIECDNNLILNCTAYDTSLGIYLIGSSFNDIINFYTHNNYYTGIDLFFKSNSNIIINCISCNNEIGINLYDESSGNKLLSNNATENNIGITIDDSSINNYIYHNNLMENEQNALSYCANVWDDGYPSGGNYWSDYNGSDIDGDGIGDTPYQIPGNNNVDRYPLMNIWENNNPPVIYLNWKPTIPNKNETVIFDASRSYDCDGNIALYEWDWDNDRVYDESYSVPTATHSWPMTGSYQFNLKVTDNDGLETNVTKTVIVNQSPEKPSIFGPSDGTTGVVYNFTYIATDPDGDNIYYEYWIWETDYYPSYRGTIGPFPSGTNATISHSFTYLGVNLVEGRTIDTYGKSSDWTEFYIKIPRTKVFNNFNWLNFLKQFPNAFPIIRFVVRGR